MRTRRLGLIEVSAIGLGCMSLSHAYGAPPPLEEGVRLLNRALDLGYTFLDTAALYGFGANEILVGEALAHRRGEYVLASKCGMFRGPDGKREIDGRPQTLKRTCEDSLQRLRTDVIDLYYLHRWDRNVPIEDSIGALAELVSEGKVNMIGLSEVSAQTLRKAHAVHPIAALQSEYSLWTRNPEVAVLDACRELGTAFVAFSPLARGFLAGGVMDAANLPQGDIRSFMPRFQGVAFAHNRALLNGFIAAAREAGCTPAQASLAWVLSRGPDVIPIPGTTRLDHLEENAGAEGVILDAATLQALDDLINPRTVEGPRYNAATQAEIDTEELPE
jgi:aryl-alcohol dehydrogenase-like predicted oxidoreductase